MSDSAKAKKTHAAITGSGSALSKYQDVMVGCRSIGATIYFECCCWLAPVPGAIGLALRKVFWPRLFGTCGSGIQFARNIILRHPKRIHLGNNVIVSEGVILDARNKATDRVLEIEDDVMLANNVSINCKGGTVSIGARTGIGAQTIIHSTNECPVTIGADGIIGPQCYLVGGGSYNTDDLDMPIWQQGIKPDSGCHLRDNVWLGAHVSVLGNVIMESGSVAATGAVVSQSIPKNTICGGVPAKVIKSREITA